MDKPWMNAALTAEERTELLLSAMTINEKIAQILTMKGFSLYNLPRENKYGFTEKVQEMQKCR